MPPMMYPDHRGMVWRATVVIYMEVREMLVGTMEQIRVVIVGNSLTAESFAHRLEEESLVESDLKVVGMVATIEEAPPLLDSNEVDVLIVAGTDRVSTSRLGPILAQYSDVPVIRIDVSHHKIQIITSREVDARAVDLVEAIKALPLRASEPGDALGNRGLT